MSTEELFLKEDAILKWAGRGDGQLQFIEQQRTPLSADVCYRRRTPVDRGLRSSLASVTPLRATQEIECARCGMQYAKQNDTRRLLSTGWSANLRRPPTTQSTDFTIFPLVAEHGRRWTNHRGPQATRLRVGRTRLGGGLPSFTCTSRLAQSASLLMNLVCGRRSADVSTQAV